MQNRQNQCCSLPRAAPRARSRGPKEAKTRERGGADSKVSAQSGADAEEKQSKANQV